MMRHGSDRAIVLVVGLELFVAASGCSDGSSAGSGAAACAAAGGQCLLAGGEPNCAKVGPQDCNPDENPGGAVCCLVVDETDAFTDAGSDAVTRCELGAPCSEMQLCAGGIEGCTSNCECLNGTWQAPCPADLPPADAACATPAAYCGYTTPTNVCGAANCDCQDGWWTCGPTCAIDSAIAADAAADSNADAADADGK
ncbi:MAG: hypothetical protein ABSC94_01395 [Polyangiaceae bacterium]|jgi:hypothetical protein